MKTENKQMKTKIAKMPQIRLVMQHTMKFLEISEKNQQKISMAERYGYIKESLNQINKIINS